MGPSLRGERAWSLPVVVLWWSSDREGRPLALLSEVEDAGEGRS